MEILIIQKFEKFENVFENSEKIKLLVSTCVSQLSSLIINRKSESKFEPVDIPNVKWRM